MKKNFTVILLIFFSATIAYSDELVDSISLIQLISNPRIFDGKKVCVSGYLHSRKDSSALFLLRTDADFQITKNAISVIYGKKVNLVPISEFTNRKDLTIEHFDAKFVKLYGTFTHKFMKETEKYSGSLYEVTRVEEIHRVYSDKAILKQHR